MQTDTLYTKLGGVNAIAAVVDDFVDRIQYNRVLNANPHMAAGYARIGLPGLKYLVTEMICWAAGGPQQYRGRTMQESHTHLKITEAEWDEFVADFIASLDKFNVPKPQQKALLDVVATTKADIVQQNECD